MAKIRSMKMYVVVGVMVVLFIPPFAKYQELRHKNKRLESEINTLKSENYKLESDKRRLETDITFIERRAREKMGVVKKGEMVIREAEKK